MESDWTQHPYLLLHIDFSCRKINCWKSSLAKIRCHQKECGPFWCWNQTYCEVFLLVSHRCHCVSFVKLKYPSLPQEFLSVWELQPSWCLTSFYARCVLGFLNCSTFFKLFSFLSYLYGWFSLLHFSVYFQNFRQII